MKALRSVSALIKNNSSLIAGPATSFCIFLLLASRSTLPADDLYFFLVAVFALCTILDGGVPYRISPGSATAFSFVRSCRAVLTNLVKASPFIALALLALIWTSPFSTKADVRLVGAYALVGLTTAVLKVMVDSARIVSLKSSHRVATDQISSAFGIARLLVVLVIAGSVPYLPVFAFSLAVELVFLCRLNGLKIGNVIFPSRSLFRRRLRGSSAYVQANLAYNTAFNIDRLAAFYVLAPGPYRALIGITSLYNMSVLPHKLIENELLFPSTAQARSRFALTTLPAMCCGAGCLGLVVATYLLCKKLGIEDLSHVSYAAGTAWVAVSTYYNRLWSTSLKDFDIAFLAKVNLWAAAIAIAVAASAATGAAWTTGLMYDALLPMGLLAYSTMNFLGIWWGRLVSPSVLPVYLGAATFGAALGFAVVFAL